MRRKREREREFEEVLKWKKEEERIELYDFSSN